MDVIAPLSYDGRVAIVTGAGRGLGKAYCLALARRGASVVVNDIGATIDGTATTGDPAQDVVDQIDQEGGSAIVDHADISDAIQAQALVDAAVQRFGRVDILITNAGIVRRLPFGSTTAADLQAHLDVHLNGTFHTCKAAWPTMLDQRYGRIVTVVSSAMFGIDGVSAYATAKGGIWTLTRSMAIEGADHGLRVNAIAPIAYTRMTASGPTGENEAARTARALDPERVAATVAVLAHEKCPTNGETYLASGSHVARVFLANTTGLTNEDVTPELLLSRWDSVMDTADFEIPAPRSEGSTTLQAAEKRQSS